ncbi:hypothetical protein QUF90_10830 [Desulfococcaceae bacterium HSG9]|nr:hypothetical protein [Desulfococcaceae bacterium HSG9]
MERVRQSILIIYFAIILTSAASFAWAGGGGQGGQSGQGRGGSGGGDFIERVMNFDADGDGKVSKEEMPKRMQDRLLQRADTNGDGAIDRQEVTKIAEGWKPGGPSGQNQGSQSRKSGQGRGGQSGQRRGGSGGGDIIERVMNFDADGDGKVSKEEMPKRMQDRLLQRADTNGDGAIDRQEVTKLAEQMGRGRQ